MTIFLRDTQELEISEVREKTESDKQQESMDTLRLMNTQLQEEIIHIVTRKETQQAVKEMPAYDEYPLNQRLNRVRDAICDILGNDYKLCSEDIKFSKVPKHVQGYFSIQIPKLKGDEETPLSIEKLTQEIFPKIASGLAERLPFPISITSYGMYLNIDFDHARLINETLKSVEQKGNTYGNSNLLKGEKIVLDYSSPNIAKTMHVGHLRSTLIGKVLKDLLEASGALTYSVNHLGDWGTQFGQLVTSYKKWANDLKQEIDPDTNPVQFLSELYKKIKKSIAEEQKAGKSELADESRQNFAALEKGDAEIVQLWQEFRRLSLIEFERLYKRLGIQFDIYLGESYYEDKMDGQLNKALDKGIASIDEKGAVVVDFKEKKLGTFLMRKSDGTSNYLTRDIAALHHRLDIFNANKILYVVGMEQKMHFQQCFELARGLGDIHENEAEHISFGMITKEGEKIASREGAGGLDALIDQLKDIAAKSLRAKYPTLPEEERERIAEKIGIGALYYRNFMQHRERDMEFDLDAMLDINNQSGPYLQYTCIRIKRLIENAGEINGGMPLTTEIINELPKELQESLFAIAEFPQIIAHCTKLRAPHLLAEYMYKLCAKINSYYSQGKKAGELIKDMDEDKKAVYVRIMAAFEQVLKRGLELLNIQVPEKM